MVSMIQSPSLSQACADMRKTLRTWAYQCVDAYVHEPATASHDQLTYTTGWEPLLRHGPEVKLLAFLKRQREVVARRHRDAGDWFHGYWREQEIHHGTEHFELFLACLARLDPQDAATREQMLDAVEHIANLSDDVPPWFDASSGLFVSTYLGTRVVRRDAETLVNVPDHFRGANLALIAWDMSGDARYRTVACDHVRQWANAITHDPANLPVAMTSNGPMYDWGESQGESYFKFAGMAGRGQTPGERAENFLASDAVRTLLRVAKLTHDETCIRAARRLLDACVEELTSPDAGAAARAMEDYRHATGDGRYDAAICDAVDLMTQAGLPERIGVEPQAKVNQKPIGIGKRGDMPRWLEDGRPRRISPITLAVAARLHEDEVLARQAVDLGHAYLRLAMEHMTSGREHGCKAPTVSAVCRGHGRENHAGVTTAVLGPMDDAFGL